jgi:hypothetical protein
VLPFTQSQRAAEMPGPGGAAALTALKILSVKDRMPLNQNAVVGRWGKEYSPVSELLW